MKKLIAMYVKFNEAIIGNKKGAAMVEYALVLAAVVGLATLFFTKGNGIYAAISDKLQGVTDALK